MTSVHDIPTAFTPPGGYGDEMPPPILAGCNDALAPDAPDLRGLWRPAEVTDVNGDPQPADHPIWRHVERVEQAGARVVVTAGGVVHDMVADGTMEHGVHDVMQTDYVTPIVVVASFEDGVLVLRPEGLPGVEVRRWRDGDHLVWQYHTAFRARLERGLPRGVSGYGVTAGSAASGSSP